LHIEDSVPSDAATLYLQGWIPADPQALLVIVHGLGEHSGRHSEAAANLSSRGIACYAFDLRGHGRSSGPRGHVVHFSDYTQDLERIIEKVGERHKELPFFLLGHSFGGLILLDALLSGRARKAQGVILSSPFLGVPPGLRPSGPLRTLARTLSAVWPTLSFPNRVDPNDLSHDPAVGREYAQDPLVVRSVSARWFTETEAALLRVRASASNLQVKVLLLYAGADRIVDPCATQAFVDAAPAAFLESTCYPELFHEILREPEKDKVLEEIRTFLSAQP
jgi:lysophospholipase